VIGKAITFSVRSVSAYGVVEADVAKGMPSFTIVGVSGGR